MPEIRKCCGLQLRTGTCISGVYSLIFSVVALGLSSYGLHNYNTYIKLAEKMLQVFNVTSTYLEINTEMRVLYIANCVDVGLYALLAIATILVIVGVYKLERYFLFPYLIVMGIIASVQVITCFIFIVVVAMVLTSTSVMQLLFVIAFTVADVLCLRCVGLYYRELRYEGAYIRANYSIRVPEYTDEEKTDVTLDFSEGEGPPPYSSLINDDTK